MNTKLLSVEKLNFKVDNFSLREITFFLNTDQYLIILGPTGCGKTILLETLAGLRKACGGKIFLRGKNITSFPPESRSFGFAYQDSLLYPFLNVKDNILFGARSKKLHRQAAILKRADKIAEAMGITHLLARYPRFLSGGEKQRVSLARAILMSPPVLLLDEPLSALDPKTRYSMQELLQEIHRTEEMGIIHVTHDFNEALQLGTDMLVMHNGEIIQQGQPHDVFMHPKSLFAARFLLGENIIQGNIASKNGNLWFKHKNSNLALGPLQNKLDKENITNECSLMIRASKLCIEKNDGAPVNNTNTWTARVQNVNFHGTHVTIVCHGNGIWQAAMSIAEWERINTGRDETVKLSVNPDDFHLISKP